MYQYMRKRSQGMPENVVAQISGVQTLTRALALMRTVTQGPQTGLGLAEIAQSAGLHRATAHRMLLALVREGLLEQDETHRFHPGVDLWMLGEAAARRFNVREFGRQAIEKIAAETQDTAYISVRSGLQSVCIGRCEGAFPIRTLSLNVGDRRPLGVGSGSLALLAFLSERDRNDVLARLSPELGAYPAFSSALIRQLVEETQARGFSFVGGTVLPGMAAVGVPVLGRDGHAIAALSVAAIEPRVVEPRRSQLVAILRAQAAMLSERLGVTASVEPVTRRSAGTPRRVRAVRGRRA
jgi:DNA-binding IclR family transcriptional regulator